MVLLRSGALVPPSLGWPIASQRLPRPAIAGRKQTGTTAELPTITEELYQYAEHYFTIHLDHEPR